MIFRQMLIIVLLLTAIRAQAEWFGRKNALLPVEKAYPHDVYWHVNSKIHGTKRLDYAGELIPAPELAKKLGLWPQKIRTHQRNYPRQYHGLLECELYNQFITAHKRTPFIARSQEVLNYCEEKEHLKKLVVKNQYELPGYKTHRICVIFTRGKKLKTWLLPLDYNQSCYEKAFHELMFNPALVCGGPHGPRDRMVIELTRTRLDKWIYQGRAVSALSCPDSRLISADKRHCFFYGRALAH